MIRAITILSRTSPEVREAAAVYVETSSNGKAVWYDMPAIAAVLEIGAQLRHMQSDDCLDRERMEVMREAVVRLGEQRHAST